MYLFANGPRAQTNEREGAETPMESKNASKPMTPAAPAVI